MTNIDLASVFPDIDVPHVNELDFLPWVREKLVELTRPQPLILQWCRVDPDGPGLHTPKCEGDIGWDLEASEDILIPAGGYHDVPTNVRVKLPPGTWAEIRARSSIARRGLQIAATVIDNGYTGPIFALMYNVHRGSNKDTDWLGRIQVRKGERVAQLVVHQGAWCRGQEVDEIPDDPRRGSAGFGSTGR